MEGHEKVLLLFRGTIEGFLSRATNPTCTPRGGRLTPEGGLDRARPG